MVTGRIPVIVNGALGKMGREVVRTLLRAEDMHLLGVVDRTQIGEDIGQVMGMGSLDLLITDDLQSQLLLLSQERQPGVMVDFTHPDGLYETIRAAIAFGIRPVVGTTGLTVEQIHELSEFADKASIGCLIAPNFSVGMVLLQQMAVQASQYFDHVEIIELHHNEKADAPSGTALKTAQLLSELGKWFNPSLVNEKELVAGVRGGMTGENIRIHSLRLPGLLAHQEVIFGGLGQTLTLRHDTTDRTAYMPGVLLGIRKVVELKSLVYGLEKIL
ncbi:MAG: 4-hydroxy-tetrahydrodipicolinate reductase [Cyanobacteriota bacterium]|nr:4-hydroxy-tetrahydrodipicolinate reductase [Cyanobacteriota bacterium]